MKRISPEKEITYISNVIEKNIEAYKILKDRGLLSQNILSQLRNFVEDVAILINNKENNLDNDTYYDNIAPSFKYISGISKYKYICKFHDYLKSTASHYTPNNDDAERLILFYFRYMCMLRNTLLNFNISIFNNLEDFPVYDDQLTKEHYSLIASKIEEIGLKTSKSFIKGRYYIQKTKPIYSKNNLYYEYTLTKANNYINKFEHITMYSKLYIPDNYSIKLSYIEKDIEIISTKTTIKIIDNYTISIRPIELTNIGKIVNQNFKVINEYKEYSNLMNVLTLNQSTILDELLNDNIQFQSFISTIKINAQNNVLSNLIIDLRKIILTGNPGCNILRYLLTNMENTIIKSQIGFEQNENLSNLYLKNKSIPFDSMPYAMSLSNYNVNWNHLIDAIDMKDREYELLAKYVKFNCENNNILYTSIDEVKDYGNIEELIKIYNRKLIEYKIDLKGKSKLILEHNYLYIKSYEEDSIKIIKGLQNYFSDSDTDVKDVLNSFNTNKFSLNLSEDKIKILKETLRKSKVTIIHGPAGTGKTKMLEVFSEIFKDYNKIFLANTNTATNNLERRISKIDNNKSSFQTVYSYINNNDNEYDMLIIDECSTISNNDMCKILDKQNYKLIILSGDIYQIESIRYGNWFSLAYNFFKNDFIYDLSFNNRTSDDNLLELWDLVRKNDDKAITKMNNLEYSHKIDDNIFMKMSSDEIVLCLNYDGLYGINNINKILQEKNTGLLYKIGVDEYKINDPIVFNDCPRFNKVLFNNMKGVIKDIQLDEENDCVWFSVQINEKLDAFFNPYSDLSIFDGEDDTKSIVKFYVNNFKDTDEDDDGYKHIIPFNLSYAISIHKAQGLEYDSVKLVVTSDIEDNITKNIFYTAITRTRKNLAIFWSPETQDKIFDNFKRKDNSKDISILKSKI